MNNRFGSFTYHDSYNSISSMRPSMKYIALLVCLSTSQATFASDQIPGKMPDGPVAIVNATIYPMNVPVIKKGTIIFEDGKITAVGKDVDAPEGALKISGKKLHVYPGLFEPYSRIGLMETSAVRATNDYRETGTLNPNVLAHVSVNPGSELIPVTRSNGVLLTMSTPSGGRIAGQGSVMQLDGWTFEDMTVKAGAAMVVSINNQKDVESLHEFLEEARRYQKAVDAQTKPRHDLRLAAMLPVLKKEQPIIVRANRWQNITRAVTFAQNEGLKLIIFGGYDAPKCADLLKEHDVPVILSAVHRKPLYRHDAYDAAFTIPQQLQKLGVRYCISGYDRSSSFNVRNLPYHAATAVAFGLTKDEALKTITLYPAQILGVADRVGSLEPGKDATLFLSTGSLFEATSQIKQAWVNGRPVDLNDKQKTLYRKYLKKYD